LALLVVGLAPAAGVYWWLRTRPPHPPVIDLPGADPAAVQAIEEARAAVENDLRSGRAWGQLGKVLLAHGLLKDARVCLAQAQEYDPESPRWPYLQGITLLRDDPDEAITQLERAVRLAPTQLPLRLQLAEALLEQQRLAQAEKQFQEVLTLEPDNPRAHLGLARLAHRQRQWQVSLDHLQRSARRAPKVKTTHVLLAEVYHRLGQPEQAAQEQRLLELLPEEYNWPDPYQEEVEDLQADPEETRLARAKKLLEQGQEERGLQILEEMVQDNPKSYRAQAGLGRALLQLAQRLRVPAQRAAYLERARQALVAARDLRPDSFKAQSDLGFVLKLQGDYQAAADCYHKAAGLKPTDALTHYHLAHCQVLQRQRGILPLVSASTFGMVGSSPGPAFCMTAAAVFAGRAGLPEAIASLRQAVRFKPNYADAHRELGDLLAANGQDAEALRHLTQASQLAPEDPTTQRLLAAVRQRLAAAHP
jgi:tetratricopeptide (TPR) repeat protein